MTTAPRSRTDGDLPGSGTERPRGRPWISARQGAWILVLLGFLATWVARDVLLPIVLALLLNLLLTPVVRSLGRLGLPTGAAAGVVVLGLLALLGTGLYHLAGPATEWLDEAPGMLRQVERRFGSGGTVDKVQETAEQMEEMTTPENGPPRVVATQSTLLGSALEVLQGLAAGLVVVLVLTYFLLASGDLFLRRGVGRLATLDEKKRAVRAAHAVEQSVGRYLLTITLINFALGAVSGIALWLLDMPNPVLFGVLIAFLNYIPYLGAIANVAIIAVVALLTFDHVGRALLVPAVTFALTSLEGHFLTPLILGRSLTLNPVMIFVALIVFVWLWGIAGALLAVPILATVRLVTEHTGTLPALRSLIDRAESGVEGAA